jgi:Ecdysteroid kinase-like family
MDVQSTPTVAWTADKFSSSSIPDFLDFEEEKDASKNTIGFLSDIVTLTRRVRVGRKPMEQIKLKVKRISEIAFRWKIAIELGIFEQEIGFFEKCVPVLLKMCAELPVVKCYTFNLHSRMMILEDLNELGYYNVVYKLIDLQSSNLKIEHVELAMRTVAKFHAASLGVDWAAKFPDLFQQDLFYERGGLAFSKNLIKKAVETTMLPAARLLFPENKKILKSVQWLASDECYQVLTKLSKADPNTINVLNHGDCWANNFLFKTDSESKKPVDAKMIDFQICRYAPISRDLLQLLYISTSSEFRKLHQSELMRVYVDAFNENCARMGRSERLALEQLLSEYYHARLFGLVRAVQMSPISHVQGVFQKEENGRVTIASIDRYLVKGVNADTVVGEVSRNNDFKNELSSMIEEISAIYDENFAIGTRASRG